MNRPNGHSPLTLTQPQRTAALARIGLTSGWVLLSVSEMYDLKKSMDGCTAENERLNKQTARILAQGLVHAAVADKTLRSARTLLETLATNSNEPTTRIDALREVEHIDQALEILPSPKPADEPKKEGT